MLAELALATVRRTERALGPAAALLVLGAALETAEGEARRTLLLAGLGAAVRAGDRGAFASLSARWASAGGGARDERGVSLVARLAAAGQDALARTLAVAEIERHRSGEAVLALAALDESGALFEEAASLGAGTRATRAALAHAAPERADQAEAALAASSDACDVLRLARAALASPRLYARVRVLDRLHELADQRVTRTAALRIALAHADLCGAALSPIERDRVLAIATRAEAPVRILETLTGRAKPTVDEAAARDALTGHAPSVDSPDRASTMALRALAAVMTEQSSAALLLSALVAYPPSPAGWTAVLEGLARPVSRAAAARCAEAWIGSGVAPPRGFSVLAMTLERAELPVLAQRAWMQAVRANDKGARKHVGEVLARRACAAYEACDRVGAKALLERSLAIAPD